MDTENRDNKIIQFRKFGMTFQNIGDRFGLSRQRVHQIYSKIGDEPRPDLIEALNLEKEYHVERIHRIDTAIMALGEQQSSKVIRLPRVGEIIWDGKVKRILRRY